MGKTNIISWSNLLKIIYAVFAFVFSIEMCARIDDFLKYKAPFWGQYNASRLKKNGVNIPLARFEKWQNNSYGFRGPEIMLTKNPETIRIICLGASETYGMAESPGREWPAQLSEMLPKNKYEVINAAVVGIALYEYIPYVKRHILPFKPDIVICIADPLLYATGYLKHKNKSATTKRINKSSVKSGIAPSLSEMILSNMRCLPRIRQLLKSALQESFPSLLKRYQLSSMQKQVKKEEAICLAGRKPMDTVPEIIVDSYQQEMNRLVSLLQENDVNVMLCTCPALISTSNLDVYPEIFMDGRRFSVEFSYYGQIDILKKLNHAKRSVASDKGTMFLDAFSLVPNNLKYFCDTVHYTDKGAELIARNIAMQLMALFGTKKMLIP